jgi:hypothetical protein
MGFISDIAKGVIKTALAPVRFVGNVLNMGWSALKCAGNLVTLDFAGAKKNLGELAQATKGAVFSGVESAFLLTGVGAAAGAAGATAATVATTVGTHTVATTAAKETGVRFLNAYADAKGMA